MTKLQVDELSEDPFDRDGWDDLDPDELGEGPWQPLGCLLVFLTVAGAVAFLWWMLAP